MTSRTPPNVSTRKVGAGSYAVLVNGKASGLYLHKGARPKRGDPQAWDVLRGSEYLFTAKSLYAATHIVFDVLDAGMGADD